MINRIMRMSLIMLCMVFFVSFDTQAQNKADMGTAVTESVVEGTVEDAGEAEFTVESLKSSEEKESPEIAAMVDESKIPEVDVTSESRYTLGATDIIEIIVMRHPEVSGQFLINNEGKIQYEFVGDVKVEGLTKDEVAQALAKSLEDFIISPDVSVKIVGYNSKIVYVVGEVARPGKIYMRGDTITVREALMQAGLPMLSGVTKKSRLITPSETGKGERKNINVYALLYEGDLRENDVMKPGDVLYIPPTFLTKAIRTINPIAAPIGASAGTARTVTTGF